jgi:hypothetical protein
MVAATEVRDPRAAARASAGVTVAVLEARGLGAQAVSGSVAISETATPTRVRSHSISNEPSLRSRLRSSPLLSRKPLLALPQPSADDRVHPKTDCDYRLGRRTTGHWTTVLDPVASGTCASGEETPRRNKEQGTGRVNLSARAHRDDSRTLRAFHGCAKVASRVQ